MGRIIGIRHRVKQTAEGEARPTQVTIIASETGEVTATYDLDNEQAEMDFLLGRFPASFRPFTAEDTLSDEVNPLHLKHRKVKSTDDTTATVIVVDGERRVVTHIADGFDGLTRGDTVTMVLGGSGDYLAFAMARRAEEVNASLYRLPPAKLKGLRVTDNKEDDSSLLARSYLTQPELFYRFRTRDGEMTLIREAQFARIDAMKARIACEQRLRQRFIGSLFCRPDGYFPEGALEKQYDAVKASDAVYQALLKEESGRERELKKLVENSLLWQKIMNDVEGCGWAITARIIASVVDIRRFTDSERPDGKITKGRDKFKTFAGVHVLPDGRFARRRAGTVSNWQPDLRQALYLLSDQMNRRPDSYWGKKLRQNKVILRKAHPEPVVVDGVRRYTDGHIHKMAVWRTLTQFTMWLYREWTRLEESPDTFALRPEYGALPEVVKDVA